MSILLDALKKSQKEQPEEETPLPVTQAKPKPPALVVAAALPPAPEKQPSPTPLPEPPAEPPAIKISLMGILGIGALIGVVVCVAILSLKPKDKTSDESPSPLAPYTLRRAQSDIALDKRAIATGPQISKLALPKVDGIVWDPDSPLAIVGGRPVRIGESSEGWTVQSITADQVRVERDGNSEIITLPEIPVTR